MDYKYDGRVGQEPARPPATGTALFNDSQRHLAHFAGVNMDFCFTGPGPFIAGQTQAQLPHIWLVDVGEVLPRIARLSLPAERTVALFATDARSKAILRRREAGTLGCHAAARVSWARTPSNAGAKQLGIDSRRPNGLHRPLPRAQRFGRRAAETARQSCDRHGPPLRACDSCTPRSAISRRGPRASYRTARPRARWRTRCCMRWSTASP